MSRVRLSRPATDDLRAALAVSRELVGLEGEQRYAATLAAALDMIAADPSGPNTRGRPDVGPGVRSLHARRARKAGGVRSPVHVIYFRVAPSGIVEIIGILHARMDPMRHLEPLAPARPRRARRR